MKSPFMFLCCIAMIAISTTDEAYASPTGAQLLERGDYESALAEFRREENEGGASRELSYNIAVTLYRLGRYENARSQFLKLTDSPKWQPLAWYNLGLIAEAENDRGEARSWYRLGSTQARNGQIRNLSQQRLDALRSVVQRDLKQSPDAGSGRIAIVRLDAGHDSNAPGLPLDIAEGPSGVDDSYAQLLMYGRAYLVGSAGHGLNLYGLAFAKRYQEFQNLNSLVAGAGLTWEQPLGTLRSAWGARLTQVRLDGTQVANQVQLKAAVERRFGATRLSAAWLPSYFFASDAYQQIGGTQQRLDLGWRRSFEAFTLGAEYRYVIDRRENLDTPDRVASYSPTRNSVIGSLSWNATHALTLGFKAEYRRSIYSGVNRVTAPGGEIIEDSRRNDRTTLSTDAVYRIGKRWSAGVGYDHIASADTFDVYDYDRNQVYARIDYQP